MNAPKARDYSRFDPQIDELIARMTLREKIGQMSQLNVHIAPTDEQREALRRGEIGSFLNGVGEHRNELQKIAVEETRLKIPLIFGRDVIHGYRTVFPIPLAQASSFNPELVEAAARVAAREASAQGIDWTFAPMVDISRDPRWGRIAESCGEDPYLASVLGVAMVRGFQGEHLTDQDRLAACAKHFVGYGATEAGKDYNTTLIPEQTLREVYLAPFQACVDAGVATLMSAFNDLNGVPASGNAFTIRKVLRDEWNFQGFVVSDWASITEMIEHGYCADERDAARAGVNARVDMEMASTSYITYLEEHVKSGAVKASDIDDCVRAILRVKFARGLFERPYRELDQSVLATPEHKKLAHEVARQSIVLLKNEKQRLPLAKNTKVALIGPLADSGADQLGCWALDGKAADSVTLLAALKQSLGEERVTYSPGVAAPRHVGTEGFAAALDAARSADVVVLCLGEDLALSGEAHCRAFLDLPGAQAALLDAVSKLGKPTVLVVMTGRPLTIGAELAKVDAVLWAWHPGTMAGPALADLLLGVEAPSGKLPVSIPRTVGQIPLYYAKKNTGRPPKNDESGIPLGSPLDPKDFTAMHMDVEQSPEFCFGFGLSYTTFSYDKLTLSTARLSRGQSLKISFDLANTGSIAGVEVAQLYLRDRVGSITRPVRELRRFSRVKLAAGEKKRVEFTLEMADLEFFGPEMRKILEAGKFEIFVGTNSKADLKAEFELVD